MTRLVVEIAHNVRCHIHSATMDPLSMDKRAYELAKDSWLCAGCARPRPGSAAIDVRLMQAPDNIAHNLVFGVGVPVAKKTFLLGLGLDILRNDLYLGKVIGPNNEVYADFVTFRGRRQVIIRGSEHVSHRVCGICGRDAYFAMGKQHLFRDPPNDVRVLESDLFGLVVPPEMLAALHLDRWQDVRIDELPILQESIDGFGELRV